MIGYIFILVGLALISYGIFLLQKEKELTKRTSSQPLKENPFSLDNDSSVQAHPPIQKLREIIHMAAADGYISPNENLLITNKARELGIASEDLETMIAQELQNVGIKPEVKLIDKLKEKGDEFERYTALKFNKKYFQLLFWAGDKHAHGIRVESNSDPDLRFRFRIGNEEQEFSVECKYRLAYYKNGVDLGEEYKINHYRKFQTEQQIPVFIAIGIGGAPSSLHIPVILTPYSGILTPLQ